MTPKEIQLLTKACQMMGIDPSKIAPAHRKDWLVA
jgi:hypothetical protein